MDLMDLSCGSLVDLMLHVGLTVFICTCNSSALPCETSVVAHPTQERQGYVLKTRLDEHTKDVENAKKSTS